MIPRGGYHQRDIDEGRIHVVGTRIVQGPAPGFVLRPPPVPPARAPSRTATSSPRTSPSPAAKPARNPADQARRAANGKIGEAVAEELHKLCALMRIAEMMKIPTARKICGRDPCDPRFLRASLATECVGVDYRGHLRDGTGRAVYSEIKFIEDECEGYSIAKLRPDQRRQLDQAVLDRAVAVLVIVRGPRRDVFALPWAVARKHRVLHTAELLEWKVRAGTPYLAHYCQRRIR